LLRRELGVEDEYERLPGTQQCAATSSIDGELSGVADPVRVRNNMALEEASTAATGDNGDVEVRAIRPVTDVAQGLETRTATGSRRSMANDQREADTRLWLLIVVDSC
jgi:hypothetical protein